MYKSRELQRRLTMAGFTLDTRSKHIKVFQGNLLVTILTKNDSPDPHAVKNTISLIRRKTGIDIRKF